MSRTLSHVGDSPQLVNPNYLRAKQTAVILFWNQTTTVKYTNISKQTVVIYAQPGSTNTLYTAWLKNMFEKFDDNAEVYICLVSLNRMVISFDPKLENEAVPVNHFTLEHQESTESVRKFSDQAIAGETVPNINKAQQAMIIQKQFGFRI